MWIVRLALRRPYTMVVGALLALVLGIVTIARTAVDIFPRIDVPVVSVIWLYGGLAPEEVERRIVTGSERGMTTAVNDIEHIESQSLNGVGVIRVFFHPGTRIDAAVAQITAICQQNLRLMPPGITPPFVLQYDASTVPVLQASLSGKGYSESDLYDFAANFIRTQLATIQGAAVPVPYGGKQRQIMVDLDPDSMFAKGITASDVNTAIQTQNLILPGGSAKFADREYRVRLNSSPEVADGLNNLPIRLINGTPVYIRDVAHVRDGFAVQNSMVRQNGKKSTLITILRSGNNSTLDVVSRVKSRLPKIMATLPPQLKLNLLFDQSVFVTAAIESVVREAGIAAILTALMILVFLGSWRSTLIVALSIPLSILISIIIMSLLGQTLNVMTLGGLALAVGILVDDATVEIENIHRNHDMGKSLLQAILDGAQQIAVPALVSTLAICIVFVPVVFLTGSAKSLFVPLAMAVVFAMLASYLLSRTLVPTMAKALLGAERHHGPEEPGWHGVFERGFAKFRESYRSALGWALEHRTSTLFAFGLLALTGAILAPFLGQDFFPRVDAGQFRLHVRAPAGTRLEETAHYFSRVEDLIREIVPKPELKMILDNIGLSSAGGSSIAFSDTATIGTSDGEILVSLAKDHRPTEEYERLIRRELRFRFPELTCFFQASDIVSQILNFGLPAPIDIQITGRAKENYSLARTLEREVSGIPGAVDVHLHQVVNSPEMRINVDRTRAGILGMNERDVANNLLISLSSSSVVTPNFWLNPQNGVSYVVAVQTPEYRINSTDDVALTGLTGARPGLDQDMQLLRNIATVQRSTAPAVLTHYNVQPTYDIYAGVQGRDLGGVAQDISAAIDRITPKLPRGATVSVRGQVESMRSSFIGLGYGLLFAILLVYFLMVVNFQSWLDPFIILMALPGAFTGIVLTLFATHTTLSVPALMGAIMSVGVATANSILLVTFANEHREGMNSRDAALEAGYVRLRPVMMTALAMIIGMLPMALGLGEGAEQNAPLGLAVIGGLILATVATLFLVPVIYSLLRTQTRMEEVIP